MNTKWLLLFFLSITSVILPMEEKPKLNRQLNNEDKRDQSLAKKLRLEEKSLEDLGLPKEIWSIVLGHLYLKPSIIKQAKDIYDAISIIQNHIQSCIKAISLVCRAFKKINISKEEWVIFKEEIRKFYIPYLNEKFLEQREGNEGLYPRANEWHNIDSLNSSIALFIAHGIENRDLLKNLICEQNLIADRLKLINLLLFYGINVEAQDSAGAFPLYWGCTNIPILKLLLQHNANLNCSNGPLHRTLLHSAIRLALQNIAHSDLSAIQILLSNGANPNALENEGFTPLHYALRIPYRKISDKNSITAILLNNNANPNSRDPHGNTVLHIAIYFHANSKDMLNVIILLLEHGANPYIENDQRQNAFDIARAEELFEFPELVDKYAQNTLLKICVRHILNNLSLYEDQLDILPVELRDKINNLRSN